jgi:putative transposase
MRREKIQAKMRKRWKKTTLQSKKVVDIAPNHLDQQFHVTRSNTVWAGDITYAWTAKGWLHVAVVLDLFFKKSGGA